MLTINTLNMGKVKVKQTPERLNPYGEKLVKIWYDDSMPPKKYIWYKDGEYHYWDGEHWEPFDWDVPEQTDNQNNGEHSGKHKHRCDCDCCEQIKFENFKKEVLAAVLKLVKAQDRKADSELENRVEELESDVNVLKQINHDLFIKNTELEIILQDMGYIKESNLAESETISEINNRLATLERLSSENIANIGNIVSRLSGHDSKIAALENANYITEEDLAEYADKDYVDDAISRINVPTKVSDLENDSGFISEVNVELIDSEEEPIVLANGDVINLVETATYNRDENKIEINRRPYQINIETEEIEPFDPSELEERIGDVEGDLAETKENVAEFKQELNENLSDNELVISAAFNDLNDRMISVVERVDKIESDALSGGN